MHWLLFTSRWIGCSGLCLTLILSSACNSAPQIAGGENSPFSGSGKKKDQKNGDSNSDDSALDSGGDDPQGSSGENIDYPEFKFAGNGHTSNDSNQYTTTSQIVTSISATEFQVNQTQARVEVGNSTGQRAADKDINETALGTTRYVRPTRQQLRSFVDASGRTKQVSYVVFATGFTNNKNETWTFSEPLPVFPWPGKVSRYTALDSGPASWTSRASSGSTSFDVTITVSRNGAAGERTSLQFESNIPTDQNGELYERLPFPKRAVYVIDTQNQRIQSIDSTYMFFADSNEHSSRRREQTTMMYRLCQETRAGTTTVVNPCP